MIIKTEDGRYVDLEKAIPFKVSKEERRELNQQMQQKYNKKHNQRGWTICRKAL